MKKMKNILMLTFVLTSMLTFCLMDGKGAVGDIPAPYIEFVTPEENEQWQGESIKVEWILESALADLKIVKNFTLSVNNATGDRVNLIERLSNSTVLALPLYYTFRPKNFGYNDTIAEKEIAFTIKIYFYPSYNATESGTYFFGIDSIELTVTTTWLGLEPPSAIETFLDTYFYPYMWIYIGVIGGIIVLVVGLTIYNNSQYNKYCDPQLVNNKKTNLLYNPAKPICAKKGGAIQIPQKTVAEMMEELNAPKELPKIPEVKSEGKSTVI